MEPREIRPGVHHWTTVHPKIHVEVSSYWIPHAGTLLDPLLPEGGLAWLREAGPPRQVILTNRHHWRHTSQVVEAFGCPVWCNALGLHEVEGEEGAEHVSGFRAGDVLPGGIETHEVGVLCPDETALRFELPAGGACLAVADGVVRLGEGGRGDGPLTGDGPPTGEGPPTGGSPLTGDGPLTFVPDFLIADDPQTVRETQDGLRAAYRRLCELDWDTLLLAHGLPLEQGGREALRAFAAG